METAWLAQRFRVARPSAKILARLTRARKKTDEILKKRP